MHQRFEAVQVAAVAGDDVVDAVQFTALVTVHVAAQAQVDAEALQPRHEMFAQPGVAVDPALAERRDVADHDPEACAARLGRGERRIQPAVGHVVGRIVRGELPGPGIVQADEKDPGVFKGVAAETRGVRTAAVGAKAAGHVGAEPQGVLRRIAVVVSPGDGEGDVTAKQRAQAVQVRLPGSAVIVAVLGVVAKSQEEGGAPADHVPEHGISRLPGIGLPVLAVLVRLDGVHGLRVAQRREGEVLPVRRGGAERRVAGHSGAPGQCEAVVVRGTRVEPRNDAAVEIRAAAAGDRLHRRRSAVIRARPVLHDQRHVLPELGHDDHAVAGHVLQVRRRQELRPESVPSGGAAHKNTPGCHRCQPRNHTAASSRHDASPSRSSPIIVHHRRSRRSCRRRQRDAALPRGNRLPPCPGEADLLALAASGAVRYEPTGR